MNTQHIQHIQRIVKNVFLQEPIHIERVMEGVSTYVYRITFPEERFYLRILPENGASFAPEVTVHRRLRDMHVKVPEVLYYEHLNEQLQHSVMITTEIKGLPLSQSNALSRRELEAIVREAGSDLAIINTLPVKGFGWIKRDTLSTEQLVAEHSTLNDFVMQYWQSDLEYVATYVLTSSEVASLQHILIRYISTLDHKQAYLAHGDLDATQIYQDNGQYKGIIDFGEIRGANREYDVGHFLMRDGEHLPLRLFPALLSGYSVKAPSPPLDERSILFTSLLINIRALVRSLQKRPANRYTQHQLEVLRRDVAALKV